MSEGSPWPPPSPGMQRRSSVLVVSGFATVVLSALVALLPMPYAVLSPGPVVNTLGSVDGRPLIMISGRTSYPSAGQLDLTSVAVAGGPGTRVSLVEALQGWADESVTVVPRDEVFPRGQTQQQTDEQNRLEMVSSQESATAAALTELDIDFRTTLTVAGVQPGTPAASVVRPGDVLLAVRGQIVPDGDSLRAAVQEQAPGAPVDLRVRRDGKVVSLRTTTVRGDQGQALLGIFFDQKFSFPFTVRIQIDDIGGPSAGLMFALGIVDRLTPGDLTGGRRIAGTGTIDATGSVGPIGGIRQKLVGAQRAGAEWFLAPVDNCDQVVGHVPDGLRVVKVADLEGARAAVTAIGQGRAGNLAGC